MDLTFLALQFILVTLIVLAKKLEVKPGGRLLTTLANEDVLYQEYLKDHEAPEDIQYDTCGPPVMTRSLITTLTELGVEEDSMYIDDFGG